MKYLTNTINHHSLKASTFPDELKQSEVITVYKKLDPFQKENYRSESLLPHISKVFERVIYKQINNFMENKISKCVTGFRESHGTQNSLIVMLEKWKKKRPWHRCFPVNSAKSLRTPFPKEHLWWLLL